MHTREIAVKLVSAVSAVLLSAVMLVLALPLGEQGYLGWIVFLPILRLVRGRGFLPAFGASLSVMFLAAWLSVTGVFYTIRDPAGSPAWVYLGFGIFGFFVCLAIGAWGDKATEKLPAWWFAGFATLLEACLLFKLPAHLALTQYRSVLMLQLAALGGVWLVSFLVWWSNFYLATLPTRRALAYGCALVAVAFIVGKIHITNTGPSAVFGVLQIATPDEDAITTMQRQASRVNSDFVVWPELSGIPFTTFHAIVRSRRSAGLSHNSNADQKNNPYFSAPQNLGRGSVRLAHGSAVGPPIRERQNAMRPEVAPKKLLKSVPDTAELAAVSALPNVSPFITSYPDSAKPLPHNTSALFSNGTTSAVYWKRKLFGDETKMHQPGNKPIAAPYRHGQAGLNICFDSCYPEVIRDTARLPGVNIIALPSIDPPATNNFIAAMHAAYTPFRAAEEGVSIVKCGGLAYSTFVDPFGQIIKQPPPGDQIAQATLPIQSHNTPYKQFGDWFLYLLGISVIARLAVQLRPSQKNPAESRVDPV